jgi:hypothetical protein
MKTFAPLRKTVVSEQDRCRLPLQPRKVKIFELAFLRRLRFLPSPTLFSVFRPLSPYSASRGTATPEGETMDWKHLLASITGPLMGFLHIPNKVHSRD